MTKRIIIRNHETVDDGPKVVVIQTDVDHKIKGEKKHNVTVDKESLKTGRVYVACNECGKQWSPNLQAGGRFPPRWWECPNGCNRES